MLRSFCADSGHAYYFLEDVYPRMAHGRRPLKTPGLVRALFPAERIQGSRPTAAPAAAPAPAAQFPAPGVVPPPVGVYTTPKTILCFQSCRLHSVFLWLIRTSSHKHTCNDMYTSLAFVCVESIAASGEPTVER